MPRCRAKVGLVLAIGSLALTPTPSWAQFSGLFLRAEATGLAYFDLTQVQGAVEGTVYTADVDSAAADGLKRGRADVRGDVAGGEARLSGVLFLFAWKQIGSARATADGLLLRVTADDGSLHEYLFRRARTAEVNAALAALALRGSRARAAWERAALRRNALGRLQENRARLPTAEADERQARAQVDSTLGRLAVLRERLADARESARAAHERAAAAQAAANTPDERYRANEVEYEANDADFSVNQAGYDVTSATTDSASAVESVRSAQGAVAELRRKLTADSVWLVRRRIPLPTAP